MFSLVHYYQTCKAVSWKNWFMIVEEQTGALHHHLALQPFVGFRLLRQVSPSSFILSCFIPVFNFQLFFRSSITSSCRPCLGLPTGLIPIGFQSSSFLAGLAWSILWICPSHLILCALMNPLDYSVWQSRAQTSFHKQFKVFLLTILGRAWLQASAAT